MAIERFPGSTIVSIGDLEFELIERHASHARDRLDRLKGEVLAVAAGSRGWTDEAACSFFRKTFKLGPLYETNALALARLSGRLVGLAGAVNDWPVPQGSLVHVCSLGLLPDVQGRGVLPTMMALLWRATLRNPAALDSFHRDRLFISAITQSPYILHFLSRVAAIYPSPDRDAPDADERAVAERVADRFDPHLAFDAATFVLRRECEFRYARMPWSVDRRLNRFCRERLDIDAGDVFVVVGRVVPAKVEQFTSHVDRAFPELMGALSPALDVTAGARA